jgi:hypothetical protein
MPIISTWSSPPSSSSGAKGDGELRFGAVEAALQCSYATTSIDFTWHGSDEGDEVSGEGWAELDDDGSISGEISFDNGDETTFKAQRW